MADTDIKPMSFEKALEELKVEKIVIGASGQAGTAPFDS